MSTCIFTKSRSQLLEHEVELLSLPAHSLSTLPVFLGAPKGDVLLHDGLQVLHLPSSSFYMAFDFGIIIKIFFHSETDDFYSV